MRGEGRFSSVVWLMAAGVNVGLLLFLLHAFGIANIFHRPYQPLRLQDDLPLKSHLPSSLRPFLEPQRPLLLVAFGQCSQCTLSRLGEWVAMLQRWSDEVKGVTVAAEEEGVFKKLWRERGWEVACVADEKGEILRALKAWFFSPRIWVQPARRIDLEARKP